ncbi:proline-rich protein PRCC-like protein [Leptotrombidium deliense]|uniref:Proline-rich protein PRCC-like protein n=1 Tax=Leptotrombidium deliense TaxID=299467 RepID=A0A443SPS5_9ACAR|nr:proline-rich protein PRCC-like protein [Leptotrombidium deliense]
MPLVAYSDDESSEDESNNVKSTELKEKSEPAAVFKALPIPKTRVTSSLNDLVLGKDLKGSLLSLLPSVGSVKVDNTKQLSMVPQSVSKPPIKKVVQKVRPANTVKQVVSYGDEEDEDDKNVEFFSFSNVSEQSETNVENDVTEAEKVLNVDIAPTLPEVTPTPSSSSYDFSQTDYSAVSTSQPDINDIAYKKIIASKFGEEPPEAINIIDINARHHIGDNREYLKTITLEKEEEFKGVEPSPTARRKHQITYLAFQAKQRELQLKNEWATNKVTKKQTRAKYGF